MAEYQAYPEYKDSGVSWMGDVPIDWCVIPCRAAVKNVVDKNEGAKDQNYLSLMAGVGVIRYEDKGDVGNKKPDDLSKCKIVRKGNLVINSMNYAIGSYGMSEYDGVCSPVYIVLEPDVDVIEKRFALRVFENGSFQKYLAIFGNGILEHRAAIGWDDIKCTYIPLPSVDVQKKIANFLDYETAKIDTLIEKQQQLIELLKEKRQAVISHAVTKGLDPNAPMRDSGVEWLGEVPEHWEVISLKNLVSAPIIDGPHLTPTRQDEGVPFISAEAISQGYINFDKKWGYISREDHELYSQRYCPQKGDILMVKLGATTGVVAMVETDDEFNVWVPLATIRAREDISSKFIFYLLQSSNVRDAIQLSWTYGTQQTLGLGTLANLNLPVPPRGDIDQIVELIESKIPIYDESVKKCELSLEYLQERRTALISAAITGKIDVRNWQAPESSKK